MAWNSKDNKSKTNDNRSSGSMGGGVNSIDVDTEMEGNIKAKGNIRIDGTLVGNLDCGALLVIGPKGSIKGDVNCQKAIIEGNFEGNLHVKEDLTLESNATVTGDVKAQKMAVLGGAQVKGTCTVPFTGSSNGKAKGNPLKKTADAAV
ncbi:polymer-forming cytoskeletal protein [Lewinella sp. 4G2]|uniref:bactofilin family protein n=1 Tax=Lewinella sp. 4G2 TaxID=1803372 RepID=UPI0007B4C077|nr:polymer-forming cytoskeletal protein [Lewinella sp. 4G2]